MSKIDLRPYGLYWDLDPLTMGSPIPDTYKTAVARKDGRNRYTFFDGAEKRLFRLSTIKSLGSGTYGETLLTNFSIGGERVVMKVIQKTPHFTPEDVINEVIAQIVVVETTKHMDFSEINLKGPFAPRVFLFAQDRNNYYILNQIMDITLHRLLIDNGTFSNLTCCLKHIAKILSVLFDTLEFNHRDLKPDNIMINEDGVKLIDFGFCCMKYGGMRISPGYTFPRTELVNCSSRTRDMNSILYSILDHPILHGFTLEMSPIKRIIRSLMFSDEPVPVDWLNTYKKYNVAAENRNLRPEVIFKIVSSFQMYGETMHAEISAYWAQHVAEVNAGILRMLTPAEINFIIPVRLIIFLKKSNNPMMIQRIMSQTNNELVKDACRQLLAPKKTNKIKGGTRKHKR
jgi:serine/threonine protein kinase